MRARIPTWRLVAAAVLAITMLNLPALALTGAGAEATDLLVPTDTVHKTADLAPVVLATVAVPADLQGLACDVTVTGVNPGSPHEGNDLTATSAAGTVRAYGVEDVEGPTEVSATGVLTLGGTIVVTWVPTVIHETQGQRSRSIWSAGVKLSYTCPGPSTTTSSSTTSTSTTVIVTTTSTTVIETTTTTTRPPRPTTTSTSSTTTTTTIVETTTTTSTTTSTTVAETTTTIVEDTTTTTEADTTTSSSTTSTTTTLPPCRDRDGDGIGEDEDGNVCTLPHTGAEYRGGLTLGDITALGVAELALGAAVAFLLRRRKRQTAPEPA